MNAFAPPWPSSPPTSAAGASSAACSRPAPSWSPRASCRSRCSRRQVGIRTAADNAALNPSVYLGIDPDGTVHIVTHRSEMGTGIRTSLPMVAADELDADWARVKIVQGIGDARYGDQNTDGSKSIRDFFDAFRQAGASARAMLIQAAAAQWQVSAAECETGLHEVVHKASGRRAPHGSLVRRRATSVPKAETLTLPRSAWRYIGKDRALYDLADIVNGKAVFGMDAKVDGMVYASIERPPVLGATLKSVDDKAALAEGRAAGGDARSVEAAAAVPAARRRRGHRRQHVGGDAGPQAAEDRVGPRPARRVRLGTLQGRAARRGQAAGKVARSRGDVDAEFAKGGKVVEASYYVPHHAHATMEPPVAVADFRDGKVTAWAPVQNRRRRRRRSPRRSASTRATSSAT